MNPKSIACEWSTSLPDLFAREVVIELANPAGNENHDTAVFGMMNIDGTRGDLVKVIGTDMDGKALLRAIRELYDYRDVCKVRFTGESLVPESFRCVRDFALAVLETDVDLEITIESTIPDDASIELLEKLMNDKTPLIDNACLQITIPDTNDKAQFKTSMSRIVEALTSCIVATREERLRAVSIIIELDSKSTMEMFETCIDDIETMCMSDDMYDDMKGIALNSFTIGIVPRVPGIAMSNLVSMIVERLNDKLFDARQVKVIPAHVNRHHE